MQEKISVIIPVYNSQKYIRECLESIINQTYKNIEIIIVNDGSGDNSLEIMKKYKELDERVIIINKTNEGVSIARNVGIDVSTSDWIMFVDSDDYLQNNAVENFAKNIENDAQVILSNVYFLENNKKRIAPCSYTKKTIFQQKNKIELIESIFYDNKKWKMKYAATPFAKLYNKKFLIENKIKFINNVKYGEDGLFNFLAYNYANKIVFIDSITYNYRIHTESVMKKYDSNLIENYNKLLIELKRVLKERHLYEIYKNEYNFFVLRQVNKFFNRYFFDKRTKKSYNQLNKEFQHLIETEPYKNIMYNEKINYLSAKRKLMLILVRRKQFMLLKYFYKLNKKLKA